MSTLISSFLFGVSHLRHLWERYDEVNFSQTQVFAQFGFTTFFGLYTCLYLFITNSLLSCVILHISCNILGLPRLQYLKFENLDQSVKQSKTIIILFNYFNLEITNSYFIGIGLFFSSMIFGILIK